MTVRLPTVGGDDNDWGDILNTFLEVAHNGDGTLQTTALTASGAVTSVNGKAANNGGVTLTANDVNAVGLGGDLGGTGSSPTVAKINGITLPGSAPTGAGQVLTSTGTSATAWQTPAATTFNPRGQVQYSTTYNPNDIVLYNGEWILIITSVTTASGTNGIGQPFIGGAHYARLTSQGYFWASDYGVVADGVTDSWATLQSLLILVRSVTGSSFSGFKVILPGGIIQVSKTIILPTQTTLEGQGLYSTSIRIAPNANCDVIQTEVYQSSSQAALLTTLQPSLTASALVNAFRWGIRDLTISGNNANQAHGSYYHGLNVQTNPFNTTAPSDPDFDPAGIVENVQFRACTGDGFYHYGRSAIRLVNSIAWFNWGNGFSPCFDTQIDHCQAGFSGIAGFYMKWAATQAAGNKSYNNGDAVTQWTSGSNYSAGARVVYNSLLYYAVNALTNDTTAPPSDTTNWSQITAATSPQAWGVGVYFDACHENTFNCDCQENSAHNWYFHNCSGGVLATGVSALPFWNNVNASMQGSNPNYYAAVCLDGSSEVQVIISCTDNAGHTATQYRLRIVNGSTKNNVILTGDTNATLLTPDSLTLLGSGNSVIYNDISYTSTLAAQNDVALSSPQNGQVLAYNSSTQQWQNVSGSGGSSFYGGLFGNGGAGTVTLDGTTTNSAFTLSGGVYTFKGGYQFAALTVNSGVTLYTNGVPLQVAGILTNNGTISNAGGNATGITAGTAPGHNMYAGQPGKSGGTGTGASGNNTAGLAAGAGGAGGSGSSGAGGSGGTIGATNQTFVYVNPAVVLTGLVSYFGGLNVIAGGSSGGTGSGDSTNSGGGSGGGGGILAILAESIVNNGIITAGGGNGGNASAGNCGGGGGGGGGTVLTYTLAAVSGSGSMNATGGAGGSGTGTGTSGVAGGVGQVVSATLV